MMGYLVMDLSKSMGYTYRQELTKFEYGICLAAWDRGLGTVVNGQGIMRSEIVREEARIPDSEVIMTCIALGYPNEEFPANGVRADREPNDAFVRYVGFEE